MFGHVFWQNGQWRKSVLNILGSRTSFNHNESLRNDTKWQTNRHRIPQKSRLWAAKIHEISNQKHDYSNRFVICFHSLRNKRDFAKRIICQQVGNRNIQNTHAITLPDSRGKLPWEPHKMARCPEWSIFYKELVHLKTPRLRDNINYWENLGAVRNSKGAD